MFGNSGKNRMMCGDSTVETDMLKLMNGGIKNNVLYRPTLHLGLFERQKEKRKAD